MEPLPVQADLLSPELEGQLDWEFYWAELRTERELTHAQPQEMREMVNWKEVHSYHARVSCCPQSQRKSPLVSLLPPNLLKNKINQVKCKDLICFMIHESASIPCTSKKELLSGAERERLLETGRDKEVINKQTKTLCWARSFSFGGNIRMITSLVLTRKFQTWEGRDCI